MRRLAQQRCGYDDSRNDTRNDGCDDSHNSHVGRHYVLCHDDHCDDGCDNRKLTIAVTRMMWTMMATRRTQSDCSALTTKRKRVTSDDRQQ